MSYRVLLDLRQFEGPLGGEVTLRMRWSIVGADGKALAVTSRAGASIHCCAWRVAACVSAT